MNLQRTIWPGVQLRQPPPLLHILLAIRRHSFEGIEVRSHRRCGFLANPSIVVQNGVEGSFVDAGAEGAESGDLGPLNGGERSWRRRFVWL